MQRHRVFERFWNSTYFHIRISKSTEPVANAVRCKAGPSGLLKGFGAKRMDVVGMILREAGILTIAGLVIGTALALASAQVLRSLLYGLKPRDPFTLVIVVVTLTAVAALASFLPAYRASRLDPLKALRYE
jgi:ABC-type antimicrobial peptide transport system permease subunit